MTIGHNGGPPIAERASNWFAVSREIFEHAIVGIHGRPYTDLEAWLSLLSMAEYDERRVMNKGTVIVLDPGQLMAAHGFLAKRWMWTTDKVRWFLQRLANEAMITRYCAKQHNNQRTNQIQVLTICNYGKYQLVEADQHQAPHQSEPQANTKPAPSQHQANTKNLTLKQTNNSEVKKEEVSQADACAPTGAPLLLEDLSSREVDALDAFQAYNQLAQRIGLPMARSLTPQRRKAIIARMREHGGREAWSTALANIERSAFLRGRNDRNWVASLDFMLQPASFTKLVDGVYGNGAHAETKESTYERTLRLANEASARLGFDGGRS
jgi:hypothetical protein